MHRQLLSSSVSRPGPHPTAILTTYFPVIAPPLFRELFSHGLTLAKKEVLLYHNLVPDADANTLSTNVGRWMKPAIAYISLVDFGRLTTVGEMEKCLHELCNPAGGEERQIVRKVSIEPLLQCTVSEMKPEIFWWAPYLNADRSMIQYLCRVEMEGKGGGKS